MRSKLPPGTLLNLNRYQIHDLIREGGFGAVYRAADLKLPLRIVAIKQNLIDDQDVVQAFDFEARILAVLDHPNMPRVTDYFFNAAGEFLVMDFIEGEDLENMVKSWGPLTESVAIQYFSQVCDALNYLHTIHLRLPQVQGPIIHRDVKPANVRITSNGRAYLVDFGIAKIFVPGTKSRMPAVTPGYSPIEQYEKLGKTDARSDIYALGATLYFCLTAQEPPESPARLSKPPQPLIPPTQHNKMVTPAMERLILLCMQPYQDQRLQSAQQVRDELAKTQQRVQPTTPSPAPPLAPTAPAPPSPVQPGVLAQITGILQHISQPKIFSNGYSKKEYEFIIEVQPGARILCTMEGYMLPLILFNGANVQIEGVLDNNNTLHVSRLTEMQGNRTWSPKPTIGWWERMKIELGLMKP